MTLNGEELAENFIPIAAADAENEIVVAMG